MDNIDQKTFEVFAKDQGEKFRTILSLCQHMNDTDWLSCREQIESLARDGLSYLEHFGDIESSEYM